MAAQEEAWKVEEVLLRGASNAWTRSPGLTSAGDAVMGVVLAITFVFRESAIPFLGQMSMTNCSRAPVMPQQSNCREGEGMRETYQTLTGL